MSSRAVPLIGLMDEDRNFRREIFESVINKPELRDVPIAIYSISGPTRTGKSYLFNLICHLLQNKRTKDVKVDVNRVIISGPFKAVNQSESVTHGVFMTTDPIFIGSEENKVAVFLMDTQGLDAGDMNELKESNIFTIGMTLSFMQIINVKNRLGQSQLENYAALSVQFHKYRLKHSEKLAILVRDWENPRDYDYGRKGGKMYLESLGKNEILKEFLRSLPGASVDCWLMPHPGKKVATSNSKCLGDIDDETWQEIQKLQEFLFSPETMKLAAKSAPKQDELLRRAKNLDCGLKKYPHDVMEGMFETKMNREIDECLLQHRQPLQKKCSVKSFKDLKDYAEELGQTAKNRAINNFKSNTGQNQGSKYIKTLEKRISEVNDRKVMELFLPFAEEKLKRDIKREGTFLTGGIESTVENEIEVYMEQLKNMVRDKEIIKEYMSKLSAAKTNVVNEEKERRGDNVALGVGALVVGVALGAGAVVLAKCGGQMAAKQTTKHVVKQTTKHMVKQTAKHGAEQIAKHVVKEQIKLESKKRVTAYFATPAMLLATAGCATATASAIADKRQRNKTTR